MAEMEGVIKYHLDFTLGDPPPDEWVRRLNGWRRVLYLTGLIGQDPQRYDGLGYGNLSHRLPDPPDGFVITGTQTGGLPVLTKQHYTTILGCQPSHNRLQATGSIRPSSESLTHGALYQLDPQIQAVIHAHSPEIWHQAAQLGLPATSAEAPYGSPALSAEIARLFQETDVGARGILVMQGHLDGLIAFGTTIEQAGATLLTWLARASV